MRLASFRTAQGESYGAVTDQGIVDLRRTLGHQFPDLKSLIAENGLSKIEPDRLGAADYQPSDVTRLPDLQAMADRTVAELGRVDILVNNAGIHKSMHTADVTEADWDRLLAVNAKGVFFASQAVLRHMVAARRGNIISLASMAGKMGLKTSLVYGITKAAVISMTRSLALAHAADGIRANCVCPGIVETDMIFQVDREAGEGLLGLRPGEYLKQRVEQIPLGRIETPADVANVVGFLASGKSSYMTGQAINVTGGLVMH